MAPKELRSLLVRSATPDVAALKEYFDTAGMSAWNQLGDAARYSPGVVTDAVLEWAGQRIAESPGSYFYLLIIIAAKDEVRREAMIALFRRRMPDHPGPAMAAAGYNLHEFNRLLDPEWIESARRHFDANPEGAWGIFESASMYRPSLVLPEHIDWFETRRASMPKDHFVSMLSLAGHRPEEGPGLLARVLRAFPEHPAAAVEGTAFAARDVTALHTPDLIAALLRHFDTAPEKAWEFFEGACRANPDLFDDPLLDALDARAVAGPGALFSILSHLMEVQPDRSRSRVDRYVALLRRHPEKGIDSTKYAFQREKVSLIRKDLVRAVCDGFAAAAYPGYSFLHQLIDDRPELIGPPEVEAAIRNIPHATNYAFGFFKELLKTRPEFTRECTLALFECLAQEPAYRAYLRAEEMDSIRAVSEAAHIRTGLEKALREPPRVGSRRARALMAIMFRQKLRARRRVLLEALKHAGGIVLWRKTPQTRPDGEQDSEKFSPIWDFVMFIIDTVGDDAVSTAAAENFLEGAFQLNYLCDTGAEHEEFLRKLDIGYPPRRPLASGFGFLEADAEIASLFSLVTELGARFRIEPALSPLEEFSGRLRAAEDEVRAIGGKLSGADEPLRRRLQERLKTLNQQIGWWRDAEYARAFEDPSAEARLPELARAFLRREKKDLAKKLRDALRAEAIRIAVAAVESSRVGLYGNRLRDILDRDVDIRKIDPRILPSFLWFAPIGGMSNNRKYLRRLIEDRIDGRPHDWMRTEPRAAEWAESVRKGQPEIRLERWRAPFERQIQYRPADALAEKKRRIKADLAQARVLLERAGATGIGSESYEALAAKIAELRQPRPKKEGEEAPPPPDPALLEEASMNLERVRLADQSLDSDFEGMITLTVETDPFEILFMGEYGFASCLSLRGSNAWSAVSNAVDIDKVIVWAKEPAGNVVGRRLLALTPGGILTYRTYVNRNGLALDGAFDDFVRKYADHCGTRVTHSGHAGPLLSDRWYDDGSI